jgi:phosphoribosylglycinamide formyltransferase 1
VGRIQVGVVASGRGTNFQSLVEARSRGKLDADLAVLVCNVPGAGVLERARKAGVPSVLIDHTKFGSDREAFEREVIAALRRYRVDLVVHAGFMRIVTPYYIGEFRNRILNIHPSLLPAFPGAHAQRDALAAGVKVSGCTVHLVDETVDGGPILLQQPVAVQSGDTEDRLASRILEREHVLLPLAVQLVAGGFIRVVGKRVFVEEPNTTFPREL